MDSVMLISIGIVIFTLAFAIGVTYLLKNSAIKKEDLEYTYHIDKEYAPISKDEVVGKLIIKYKEDTYEFDLYAYEVVEQLKFGSVYLNSLLKMMFS